MPNNYGPKIVTDGLLTYLDAGNPKSYPGSGTAWTDISRNGRNGTLSNATYSSADGGSVVFNGTNSSVGCTGTAVVSAATFLVWINRNGDQGQYDAVLFTRSGSSTGLNFFSGNQIGYHWNNSASTYNWASGLAMPNLQWCIWALSVTSTSATAYLCQRSGITSAVNTVSHPSVTITNMQIGQDTGVVGRLFAGNIAVAQIYNRALSRDEILQNYNATKGRFKL